MRSLILFSGNITAVVKDGVLIYKHAEGYHTYDKLRKVKDTVFMI